MNERQPRGPQNGRKTNRSIIETHPRRSEIEKDLLEGMPQRAVANKYGLSTACVHRYSASKFAREVNSATSRASALHADSLAETLTNLYSGVSKLYRACDDWLTDPSNPEAYTLEPRASEIDVIYYDANNCKRRGRLQDVLNKADAQAVAVQRIDTRALLLQVVDKAGVTLERIGRMTGAVTEQVDVTIHDPREQKLLSILSEELEGYPEILERVAARIALL